MNATIFRYPIALLGAICLSTVVLAGERGTACEASGATPELLVYFNGEEQGFLARSIGDESPISFEYNPRLDSGSFTASFNGRDVSDRFTFKGASDSQVISLPLKVGVNKLVVTGALILKPNANDGCVVSGVQKQTLTINYGTIASLPRSALEIMPQDQETLAKLKAMNGSVQRDGSSSHK